MGKGIRLALLACGVLVCAGLYAFLPREAPEPDPTPEPAALPVLSVSAEDIAALSWENAARTLHFEREDTGWRYTDDKRFPMDQDSARFAAILDALEQITAARYLSDVTDPAEYGLDAPANIITLTLTDGSAITLTLGGQNPVTFQFYLQVSGDPGVYLIDGTLPQAFDCGLFDLVKTDPIPDLSTATEYRVNGRTYRKDEQGQWLDGQGDPIGADLSGTLTSLRYAKCIDYYADSDEVQNHEYALENGKTVTVLYRSGGEDAEWKLVIGKDYDDDHVIVSPAGSDLVYTLDRAVAEILLME